MRTAAAAPYLLPPEAAIDASPWTTPTGAQLPERLEHWDPFTTIDVSRTVTIDTDHVRSACRLAPDARLAVAPSWYSNTTRVVGGPTPTELGDMPGKLQTRLTLLIPGSEIGGRTDLRTRIVLRHPGSGDVPIAPTAPGTILWMDQTSLLVEGSAARFPVTAVDFTALHHPTGAGWILDWDRDLTRPLLGSMRLLVNTAHPTLIGALASGAGDERAQAVQSFVTFDVARTMVQAALADEVFVAAPHSYDEATAGRAVNDLIETCWPGVPVATLAVWSHDHPARIDAQLQAHLGTLS